MPHADAAVVPPGLDKAAFWAHVHDQLAPLLDGQRNWVTNLANAAALLYHALLAYAPHFGAGARAVNWCGFYVVSDRFPAPLAPTAAHKGHAAAPDRLLLGPFCGRPACQFIRTAPGAARGVCADAFLARRTVRVADVGAYPGHIACDGDTKSEIVVPLVLPGVEDTAVGVLDLDCLALGGFTPEDQHGLERIARLVVSSCDW